MSAGHTFRHCARKGCANEAAFGSWCVVCVSERGANSLEINLDNGGFWYGMEERI